MQIDCGDCRGVEGSKDFACSDARGVVGLTRRIGLIAVIAHEVVR